MAETLTPQVDFVALRERAPEFLGDLMDHTIEVMIEGGVPRDQAEVFGLAIALRLRPRWAKQIIYFAEGRSIDLRGRNQKIWEDFDGRNVRELAVKYNVSEVWIRALVKAMRAEYVAVRQGQLGLE